jgi:hypothetical protein
MSGPTRSSANRLAWGTCWAWVAAFPARAHHDDRFRLLHLSTDSLHLALQRRHSFHQLFLALFLSLHARRIEVNVVGLMLRHKLLSPGLGLRIHDKLMSGRAGYGELGELCTSLPCQLLVDGLSLSILLVGKRLVVGLLRKGLPVVLLVCKRFIVSLLRK